jgi:hypothetical protein
MAALRNAKGQSVELSGRGYASKNGHHHAPPLMQVARMAVLEHWTQR